MRVCLLAAACAALASAGPVHKVPQSVGWDVQDQVVADGHPITVRFALTQQNLDKLYEVAARVSDPQSELYGQYLSTAELRKLTAPKVEHVKAVEGWLAEAGVQFQRLDDGEVVEAQLTVGKASKLLNTHFKHLKNRHDQSAVRAGDYHLPEQVDAAVSAVYGLHGLPLPPQKLLTSAGAPANVTPAVLAKTYGISGVSASGSTSNRQAVAEFQGQTIDPKDLESFFKKYASSAPSGSQKVYKFVGDSGTGKSGVEAALDIEYIMGVAPGALSEFWYWANTDFCGDLKNWTSTILASKDAPLVHSVSYGWQGSLEQIGCKDANVQDVDANLAKLAAKGVTIIFASGDSGSGYAKSCDSSSYKKDTTVKGTQLYKLAVNDESLCCRFSSEAPGVTAWTYTPGKASASGSCTLWKDVTGTSPQSGAISGGEKVKPAQFKIYPSWPASSPWVTAVGATRFQNQEVGQPEMATDQFGSGGGFSTMFDAFKAQQAAVKQYLSTAKNLPPKGSFPPAGRATPDISALGEGYRVVANGQDSPVGGTSASTPAFAGMVSLLNEARIKAGKPAMGYLNPFLYQNADAFTDVTVGTNAISRGGAPVPYGFSCAKGWDPATGLGTPIFSKLLSAAMAATAPREILV